MPYSAIASAITKPAPENWIFIGGDSPADHLDLLKRPDISGVQVIHSWKSLEPEKERYDFSRIDRDLALLAPLGKKLFLQIQDRFFFPTHRNIPDYVLTDPIYAGGLVQQDDNAGEGKEKGSGWVTIQWNPEVRARYQKLLKALGDKYDGKVFGINLPETAIEVQKNPDNRGFTCDAYFDAEIENLGAAKQAFPTSHVVQYVNFWPCEWNNDRKYMERTFDFAKANGIGLGGPDIIPYRRGQMKNSYPFFNKYQDELPLIAMAVQGPTLTYTNPRTGKKFTRAEFQDYAADYLGVDIIFWTVKSSWLQENP
ncbi:beta-galactosidase [Parasphingorhabdus cellanae]|uniref:Beta-galactosidase n=1 Tax=Parasphingorhabdus cellanae TaxID=2806553 RepID=A0ABX7TAF8_9SPHN|nr:beta-galactosidase [Parasphingorhabdus cellanae]